MRNLTLVVLSSIAVAPVGTAAAQGVPGPTLGGPAEHEAASGIKEAMVRGVQRSTTRLGRPDGFLRDTAVKIALPRELLVAEVARKNGSGRYIDDVELAMNRAAERAVSTAADVFADAVREMSITDAFSIVGGSADAGTQYFRRATQDRIRERFMPIVAAAASDAGVASRVKALADRAGGLGSGTRSVDLDSYVTDRAMDGLFYYVAQEELQIRQNPVAQGSTLLRRVFGR